MLSFVAAVTLALLPAPPASGDPVVVTGTIAHAGGAPAEGVAVELVHYAPLLVAEGAEQGVERLSTKTGELGAFRFEFDAEPERDAYVVLAEDGFVRRRWSWNGLVPGDERAVGPVALEPAGRVRVRLVDVAGAPLPGDWLVVAEPEVPQSHHDGLCVAMEPAGAEPVELVGLLPGVVNVRARSKRYGEIRPRAVEVRAGLTAELVLVHDGPEFARAIVVALDQQSVFHTDIDASDLRLHGADGTTRVAEPLRSANETFVFPETPDGVHEVELSADGVEPWRSAPTHAGELVVATVAPESGLTIEVRGADGAGPVNDAVLTVTCDSSFTTRRLHLDPSERRHRLPPGNYRIFCEAPGFEQDTHFVRDLRAGEQREVEFVLPPKFTIEGRVLSHDGRKAFAGAIVNLRPSGAKLAYHHPDGGGVSGDDLPLQSVFTDESGRFVFESIAEGSYSVQAFEHVWLHRIVDRVRPPLGRELEVRMPEAVDLRGRLVGGPVDRIAGLTASIRMNPATVDAVWALELDGRSPRATIDEEGWFVFENLPHGTAELRLEDPEGTRPNEFSSALTPAISFPVREETENTLDASTRWPATIEVQVSGDTALAKECRAVASDTRLHWFGNAKPFGEDGKSRLRGLYPEEYAVHVRGPKGEWEVPASDPLRVAPGEKRVITFQLVLATGRVRVIDGTTGELCTSKLRLRLPTRPSPSEWPRIATGSDGWTPLTLPAGRFELHVLDRANRSRFSGTLTWTTKGPESSVVVLEPTE